MNKFLERISYRIERDIEDDVYAEIKRTNSAWIQDEINNVINQRMEIFADELYDLIMGKIGE